MNERARELLREAREILREEGLPAIRRPAVMRAIGRIDEILAEWEDDDS